METDSGIETPATELEESDPSTDTTEQEAVTTPDDAGQDEASAADDDQTPEGDGEQRPNQPKVVKELIHTRKRAQQAEQEAAYWRGVAEGRIKPDASQQPQPQVQAQAQGEPPPDRYDYDTDDDYNRAVIRYEARQEYRKEMEKSRIEEERKRIDSNFSIKLQEAAKTDPEIVNIVSDPTIPINQAMAYHIKISDIGPQLVRYLHENQNEAARIYLLNPIQAAAELGRIEAKLTQPPPTTKKVSQAPEPAKPLGGSRGATETDLDKLPINEFMKRRNKEEFSRR